MKCSCLWNLPKHPTLLLLCPDSDILTAKVKKTKNSLRKREYSGPNFCPDCHSGQHRGQSGCRDASHPACCFLTVYLGSTLARRKSWQPRPAGITSLSFLNVFEHFSWIPRSGCSLELHDNVRLCVWIAFIRRFNLALL